MEQNKNRYAKFKLSKFEIIMLIIAGVFLILAIADKIVKSSAADYFGPSDVEESDIVLQSYDGQTALVPQSYIDVDDKRYNLLGMNYVDDRFYPVYMSNDSDFLFTNVESNKQSITYYTSNSEGGFVGSFVTDQGISGIDYFIIRGLIWNVRAHNIYSTIPVGTKGISYAPVTEWKTSASSILYWVVGSGNSASYYALSSSDLSFDIDHQVIQLKSGVTYNLVTWDPELHDWDLVSTTPTQNYLDSLPIDNVIRLKGPRFGIVLDPDNYLDFDISYFSDDVPATPTPTPDASTTEYHILLNHVNGVFNHTSYMVSFKASGILNSYNQPLNSTVESVLLESNTESTLLKYNASIKKTGSYGGSWLGSYYGTGYLFYVKCSSFSDLKLYKNSSAFVSNNFSYIENNYSFSDLQEGSLQNQGNGYDVFYYVSEVDDGYILAFSFKTGEYGDVSEFDQSSDIWFQEGNINSTSSKNYLVPFQNDSDQYKMALGLMLDVQSNAVPDPNISPTPSPSPEPTAPPYVIVVTEPLPTPINWIDYQDPGYPNLKPGDLSTGFDDFESKFSGGNGIGLLAAAYSFIPAQIRSIVWLVLLIAVILATIRVFLHFFG